MWNKKNPFIEKNAAVKVLSNLVSGGKKMSNVSAVKDDKSSSTFLSEFMLR